MGINFTDEQREVIRLRDRNILVSAAAGSGKTAVLVERIITRLTKDERPLNVDELLVLTYTEAAASEMKERIHAAIEKALEEDPGNVHLQQQATLIHQAQITTIHKFCMSVIKDYFHTIDLDPGFRVGEDGELKLLKQDVVEAVIEAAYEKEDDAFIDFVENFSTGKSDQSLDELILKLFDISRSYPNPKKWLDFCVEQYQISSKDAVDELPFVKEVLSEIKVLLQECLNVMEYCLRVCREEPGLLGYETSLLNNSETIRNVLSANSFSELQNLLKDKEWKTIGRCANNACKQTKEQVQELVNGVKKYVQTLQNKYCSDDLNVIYEEMCAAGKDVKVLTELVNEFAELYGNEKKKKNLIDFNDMEQFALRILTRIEGDVFVPSEVSLNYQEKFAEVMVDEYQDINTVQETILTTVSK